MTDSDRLEKLRQQRERLNQQIRQEETKLREEERKRATRRKIILGGLVEKHCSLHPSSHFTGEVQKLIEQYVEGNVERALFDLPPKPERGEKKGTIASEATVTEREKMVLGDDSSDSINPSGNN